MTKGSAKPSELMGVLDYVLNRCTIREIDALEAAVERRRKDLSAETGLISLDPMRAAKSMSGSVQNSINQSMDSIRGTFRTFAAEMLRKEAPELSMEQMEELIDQWIPQHMSVDSSGRVTSLSDTTGPVSDSTRSDRYAGLARKGLVNGIPSDAMYEMITQFVEYSLGSMSVSSESSLRAELGDWTTIYWKKFPREIQELIKKFLSGTLSGADFDLSLSELLQ
jgi:hypothetical protein